MIKVGRLERIACPGKEFKGKWFPRKEKVVGRLKVRVRGPSRSAAHKRIFILGSSVCCERANRTGGQKTLCCEEGRVTKEEVP